MRKFNLLKAIKSDDSLSLTDSVNQYRLLLAEIKRLEGLKNKLKKEIIDKMDGSELLDENQHVIATLIEKNRSSVDLRKLETNYNDAYVDCLKITTYQEFRVK